jgi:spore coat protein A, manganese oxidase
MEGKMTTGKIRTVFTVAVALACLALSPGIALPQGFQLPGNKIPQFVDPLPVLDLDSQSTSGIATLVAGPDEITLNMVEFQARIMPSTFLPATGTYTGTWTFGYRVATPYPADPAETPVGPVIVATRHIPTQIRYVNNLTDAHIFWREWTDQSLHSAYHQIYGQPMPTSGDALHYPGPVPAVPHLHGGEVPAVIDGGPEAYFLSNLGDSDGVLQPFGRAYYTKAGAAANEAIYRYPNSQEAAPLWFHDHLLGGTRINATYAGLAGAYPIIDPLLDLPTGMNAVGLNNGNLDLSGILGPEGANTELLVPLVIQDRMFDTNGQLFFPNVGVNPEHPFWVPEFVGDTIVVNGKVWPYLNVDRKRYRFYLIDGSNSRAYDMFLQDLTTGVKGPRMWVIANDGGYLDKPVPIDPNATGRQVKAGVNKSLVMMPGERYEIIVDFGDAAWLAAINAAYGGAVPDPLNLVLRNTAPTVDGNPKASLDGRIMQFRVSNVVPVDGSYNPASGIALRPPMVRLPGVNGGPPISSQNVQKIRELTLNEVGGPGGPLEALVNNSKWNGKRPDTSPIPGSTSVNPELFLTELPNEGDTEVWEIVNLTADAHPIHLHGVQFQILNRQAFDVKVFSVVYDSLFPNGVFVGGYGPPLPSYDPLGQSGGKYGGNPDVTPYLVGAAVPASAYEAGWKDTAIMPSGQVSRIVVRFAPQHVPVGTPGCFPFDPSGPSTNGDPSYYVWHCHITDHEDNEMMRPYQFQLSASCPDINSRAYKQGTNY